MSGRPGYFEMFLRNVQCVRETISRFCTYFCQVFLTVQVIGNG